MLNFSSNSFVFIMEVNKVIYNFRLRYFTAISRKVVGKSALDNPLRHREEKCDVTLPW